MLLRLLGLAALLALGVVLGVFGSRLFPGPLEPRQDAAVQGIDPQRVAVGPLPGGRGIEVAPVGAEAHTVFLFYPGGLVRPPAYTWLGVALAPVGVRTLIPAMPLDLAVLAPNRANELLELRRGETRVVLGGHSLGGVMAARWARAHPERVQGLVLLGAYPAAGDDLSELSLPTLVVAAERDGLVSEAELQAGLARLPIDTRLEAVAGAVHAFFGRYGPQRGDGTPTVTRAEAERAIVAALRAFLAPDGVPLPMGP